MRRPDGGEVLLDDALGGAAALGHVPLQPPDQAHVGIGVDEHLEVEALAQRRLPQHEDPLDDHDLRRADDPHVPAAGVLDVVVHGHGHRRAGGERGDVVVEQRPVEGVGVVVVERLTLLARKVVEGDVVGVELEQREVLLTGELGETLGDGGLAGGRSAGDTDEERSRRQLVHRRRTLPGRAPGAWPPTTMPTSRADRPTSKPGREGHTNDRRT